MIFLIKFIAETYLVEINFCKVRLMNNIDIAFVILNYNIFDETINCIDSIKKNLDTNNFHIVLVDNISPNNIGIRLRDYFVNDEYITVILNDNNVGFAKGNNIGINYVRNSYNAKFICCLNNDTLLEQKDFFKVLKNVYQYNMPAVIGPKIILEDSSVQSLCTGILPIDEYKKQLNMLHYNGVCKKFKNYLLQFMIIRYCNKFRHKLLDMIKNNETNIYHKDVVLHGSCLIFTERFFDHLDGFNPDTFLFREEELLYISVKEKGMYTLYCPDIYIRHLEDKSTNSVYKTSEKKIKFLQEQQFNSLSILINKLENSKVDFI